MFGVAHLSLILLTALPASLARRYLRADNAAKKNAVHASAVENYSTAFRGTCAAGARWLFLLFFYTITERGATGNITKETVPIW